MQHFAEDDYSVEKAIARYEGLPFLPKVADSGLQVGRADLDTSISGDQHFLPHPTTEPGPFVDASPFSPNPTCPECGSDNVEIYEGDSEVGPYLVCNDCGYYGPLDEEDYFLDNNDDFYKNGSKNCNCWDGYKRVPGTKPCAPGSCEKCDSNSKKSFSQNPDDVWNEAIAQFIFNNPEEVDKTQTPFRRINTQVAVEEINAHKDEILSTVRDPSNYNEILEALARFYNLSAGSYRSAKNASQGDKPSPKAAQAVFAALASGNEEGAKDLLKQTDCPEGCETHPEGKCNHQYMAAGRTRVRYLINDSSFDKEDDDFGTTGYEGQKESANIDSDALETVACPRCKYPSNIFHNGKYYQFDCPKCHVDIESPHLDTVQRFLYDETYYKMMDKSPAVELP